MLFALQKFIKHINGISVQILVFCISTENERFVDGDEWVASTFHPTPIMSTYLLAFTVNEFKSETATHDTKEISVCYCLIIFIYLLLQHLFILFHVKNYREKNEINQVQHCMKLLILFVHTAVHIDIYILIITVGFTLNLELQAK